MAERISKPLSLYLHFPFCVRKCRYCDFLSFPADAPARQAYLDRLEEEIRFRASEYRDYTVETIFFGGGTPSLMTGDQISHLMQVIRETFSVAEKAEVTIECNPGTADEGKMCAFLSSGINRISFGLQSMEDGELACLGRIHNRQQFIDAYACARKAGFENINVDLMSALPGQSLSSYINTLSQVLALDPPPEHISAYSLIIEEGTPFGEVYQKDDTFSYDRGQEEACRLPEGYLPLPDEDSEREMYHRTKEILRAAGYERYEISNYARPGYECRHNLTYWYRGDYLGLGLGASGMTGNRRFKNTDDLSEYMNSFIYEEMEHLTHEDQMAETVILGLRCMKGISLKAFEESFGCHIREIYGDVISEYEKKELLKTADGRMYLTDAGIDVSNWILSDFMN